MENNLINIANHITNTRVKYELNSYAYYQSDMLDKVRIKTNKNAYLYDIDNNENIKASFILEVSKNKSTHVHLTFDFKKPYPFYSPEVKLFNYDYKSMLRMDVSRLNLEGNCLCCDSILCRNNWNVQRNLSVLFDEIHKNLNLKIRLSDLIICNHIVEQIFGTYLPIDTFL
tara:strand:+ start:2096 stop:2608 length:513 start_codon:yes stop_codon:yes gene_type:complete